MGGSYTNESLIKFIDQIINEKGDIVDANAREEEKEQLLDLLNDEIDEAMIGALPDDKSKELEKLLDEKGDDATENEITAIVYGSQNLINAAVEKTMAEFREEYLRGEI